MSKSPADLDFRGTLRLASDGEVPVRSIRLIFDLRGATEERLVSALHLTELYCVVYRTLVGGVPISVPG